jgi:hypothetical protein
MGFDWYVQTRNILRIFWVCIMWMVYQSKVTTEADLITLSPPPVYGWCTKQIRQSVELHVGTPLKLPPYPELAHSQLQNSIDGVQCPPIMLAFSPTFSCLLLHLNPLTKLPHFRKLLHIAFAVQSVISNANHLLRPVLRRDLKQYSHQTALANSK